MQTKAEFFVILADGAVDQIAQGKRNADREARDLKKMGFAVVVIGPATGGTAQDISDQMETGRLSVKGARQLIKAEAV